MAEHVNKKRPREENDETTDENEEDDQVMPDQKRPREENEQHFIWQPDTAGNGISTTSNIFSGNQTQLAMGYQQPTWNTMKSKLPSHTHHPLITSASCVNESLTTTSRSCQIFTRDIIYEPLAFV